MKICFCWLDSIQWIESYNCNYWNHRFFLVDPDGQHLYRCNLLLQQYSNDDDEVSGIHRNMSTAHFAVAGSV